MTDTTLFCIPFAGGNKTLYYPMRNNLPSHIQFKPLELPGRGERFVEPALDSIDDMVDDLVNQIIKEKPGEFILLGYSLGTILAYELYYKLDQLGYRPKHMILCASAAIGCLDRNNGIEYMDDKAFKQFVKDKGGTPDEILNHEELWELVKPALKNDFLAIDYYCNKPKERQVEINLSVFVGKQDSICDNNLYKWSELTKGDVDYRFFEGDHFFINNHYKDLSEEVKLVLND
ncbi:thioesterase II family protein [Staphylococcus sp. NAM3COL9]|uniref:thioesterase II family protein n=1 Tax=Staphylococcus sp. NAM3COL9 TaxID=1667172 RepID=UPI000710D06B|nr:thioesterase domain-containing protein [Staphylococcus sp. NAM3COL9]KRG11050.1 gramicidin dehydrogenase [Staphylococcus sp. NAM3COL9]